MAQVDKNFRAVCLEILQVGRRYQNESRGVERLQIPSYTFRHDLRKGMPFITNKSVPFKSVVGELIWFLRGDTDIKYLKDNKIPIWDKDAYNWYKKDQRETYGDGAEMLTFEEFAELGTGSVGRNYSAQWRNFNGDTDQIADLIIGMKENIMSSRLKVNAWNPSETEKTALPPCHSEFQVIGVPLNREEQIYYARLLGVNLSLKITIEELNKMPHLPKFGFELHWNQRSVDTFLGLPFNIASYGVLAKILENITGYPALAIEGTLKCVHFYGNQYEAVEELMKRDPDTHHGCSVEIKADLAKLMEEVGVEAMFDHIEISDFVRHGYTSDEQIKVDMLAPKEI